MDGDQLQLYLVTGRCALPSYTQCVSNRSLSLATSADPFCSLRGSVEKNEIVTYPCYWCEIDNACHDVGSVVSPCSPPSADSKCVSLSPQSNCAGKDVSACPASL